MFTNLVLYPSILKTCQFYVKFNYIYSVGTNEINKIWKKKCKIIQRWNAFNMRVNVFLKLVIELNNGKLCSFEHNCLFQKKKSTIDNEFYDTF